MVTMQLYDADIKNNFRILGQSKLAGNIVEYLHSVKDSPYDEFVIFNEDSIGVQGSASIMSNSAYLIAGYREKGEYTPILHNNSSLTQYDAYCYIGNKEFLLIDGATNNNSEKKFAVARLSCNSSLAQMIMTIEDDSNGYAKIKHRQLISGALGILSVKVDYSTQPVGYESRVFTLDRWSIRFSNDSSTDNRNLSAFVNNFTIDEQIEANKIGISGLITNVSQIYDTLTDIDNSLDLIRDSLTKVSKFFITR